MSDDVYDDGTKGLDFTFTLYPLEGKKFTEGGIDHILDTFLEAVEQEGYTAGGGVGPPPPEENICQRCEGVGIVDPIPEERKCPRCEGSGEVDPDSMSKEEWDEIYAPVAQGIERSAPTGEAGSSNLPGGTKC